MAPHWQLRNFVGIVTLRSCPPRAKGLGSGFRDRWRFGRVFSGGAPNKNVDRLVFKFIFKKNGWLFFIGKDKQRNTIHNVRIWPYMLMWIYFLCWKLYLKKNHSIHVSSVCRCHTPMVKLQLFQFSCGCKHFSWPLDTPCWALPALPFPTQLCVFSMAAFSKPKTICLYQ